MSEWRPTGTPCPIDEQPLDFDKCHTCPYFRGASLPPRTRGWKINCNWPRNGSHIARQPVPKAFSRAFAEPIPDAFIKAFQDDDEDVR